MVNGRGERLVGVGRIKLSTTQVHIIIISKSHLHDIVYNNIIAKRILDTLKSEDVTNLDSFCSKCMFIESPSDDCKNKQFPQCGGKLVDSYWLRGAPDIL